MADHAQLMGMFIFWGKVAGAAMAFGSVVAFFYQKLVSPVVRKIININSTITKLDTNCIPTLQTSMNRQDVVLKELKDGHAVLTTQIEKFGSRQENLEQSFDTVHRALLNHLENTSREKRKKVKV